MLATARRVLRTLTSTPNTDNGAHIPDAEAVRRRVEALETHVKALYDHVTELRREEAQRAAEHATMVDQLTRLYKRVSARIAREPQPEATQPFESVLDMRRRIRGS